MTELITFQADAAIIDRLGRELVAKQETALIELVKNAFDADATEVEVIFGLMHSGGSLEIRDNGSGMTREELIDGFLRLASDMKVREPLSRRYRRQRAGRKGIGRFAAQRLGTQLTLTTCAEGASNALRLTVNWDLFVHGGNLENIPVKLEEVESTSVGTTLQITGLRDSWTEAQVRRCWRAVIALQQPFPVAPVANNNRADPGFSVRFLHGNGLFRDETIADMKTEIFDHLHAVIEMEVDEDGRAVWRISSNKFGPTTQWMLIHHDYRDSPNPPRYDFIHSVRMKSYYVILLPELLPPSAHSKIRDIFSEEGGIRLYRNGFRVPPYGDRGDDWLQLDEVYAKRGVLVPIANRNFFGFIEVHDPEGKILEERTSREGVLENPAFHELQGLASAVLITAATKIGEDRGRKAYAGRSAIRTGMPTASPLGELKAVARAIKESAERASKDKESDAASETARLAEQTIALIDQKEQEIEAKQIELVDELSMLRFLATLGMTTAEFSHEAGMTFEAFRMDFERIFEVANAIDAGKSFNAQVNRAKLMLDRLDSLTAYLNSLAAARALRGMTPLSLSKAVEDFERGMREQARIQNIALQVEVPEYDPLFTRPMHQAELASVLLNFFTNSIKAVKRAGRDRRIAVMADRVTEPEPRVRLRFADSGDGIKPEHRDRIFDAFFTTRAAPPGGASDVQHASGTGLGLWIVAQIVGVAGGEITVTDPPPGYATCLEVLFPPESDDD